MRRQRPRSTGSRSGGGTFGDVGRGPRRSEMSGGTFGTASDVVVVVVVVVVVAAAVPACAWSRAHRIRRCSRRVGHRFCTQRAAALAGHPVSRGRFELRWLAPSLRTDGHHRRHRNLWIERSSSCHSPPCGVPSRRPQRLIEASFQVCRCWRPRLRQSR